MCYKQIPQLNFLFQHSVSAPVKTDTNIRILLRFVSKVKSKVFVCHTLCNIV